MPMGGFWRCRRRFSPVRSGRLPPLSSSEAPPALALRRSSARSTKPLHGWRVQVKSRNGPAFPLSLPPAHAHPASPRSCCRSGRSRLRLPRLRLDLAEVILQLLDDGVDDVSVVAVSDEDMDVRVGVGR